MMDFFYLLTGTSVFSTYVLFANINREYGEVTVIGLLLAAIFYMYHDHKATKKIYENEIKRLQERVLTLEERWVQSKNEQIALLKQENEQKVNP